MNRFVKYNHSEDSYSYQENQYLMSSDFNLHRDEAETLCHEGYKKQIKGAVEEAIKLYERSIELCPTAEAHTFLGWAYSTQGRFDEAILECQKAIGIDEDFGNPYNDIGAYLIEMEKYEDAIPWLQKATQSKRYDAHFYAFYNLGCIWEKKAQWFKAFEAYSKALEYKPDYKLARQAIGRLSGLMN